MFQVAKAPNKRILIHALGWAVAFLISFFFFSDFTNPLVGALKSLFTTISFMLVFYLNTQWLMPQYFEKGRYALYCGLLGLVIATVSLLRIPVELNLLSIKPQYSRPNIIRLIPFLVIFSTTILAIISTTIQLSLNAVRYRTQKQVSENRQLEAELSFLKAQINPHFLFNTLNNLYTLALLKSDQTPDMIAKLAELMRYLIYEANSPKVPVAREISFLENYIELYRLRYGHQPNLSFEIKQESKAMIEPMLFISLVENCFKYADLDRPGSFIDIKLEASERSLLFVAHNSIDRNPNAEDQYNGIGLNNLTQRLHLLYPNQHRIEVGRHEERFEVLIELQIFMSV